MDRPESASAMFMPPEIHDKDYMCWGGKILVGKSSCFALFAMMNGVATVSEGFLAEA